MKQVNFDPSRPEGLYVHIPFCATKCPYCDFNTYAGIEGQMGPYLAALRSEIELWGEVLGGPGLETVFFGGGTPSYLPEGSLGMLLDAVRGAFGRRDGDAEITAEANPDDLHEEQGRVAAGGRREPAEHRCAEPGRRPAAGCWGAATPRARR